MTVAELAMHRAIAVADSALLGLGRRIARPPNLGSHADRLLMPLSRFGLPKSFVRLHPMFDNQHCGAFIFFSRFVSHRKGGDDGMGHVDRRQALFGRVG